MTQMHQNEWTEAVIRALDDDTFKKAIRSTAMLLKLLKDEAIRRGVWDELKGSQP